MVTRNEMVEMLGAVDTGVVIGDLTGADIDANPHNRATKTYTGVVFDLFDPGTWEFRLPDIARSLSNICRWAGHIDPRSVGQHCIHVSEILRDWGFGPEVQKLGLAHDASETYLLDIPRPWKGEVWIDGRSYLDRETQLEENLFEWAGISEAYRAHWHDVKKADLASFEVERASRARDGRVVLPYEHPDEVMLQYISMWNQLTEEIG